jgi:hypothetical protein
VFSQFCQKPCVKAGSNTSTKGGNEKETQCLRLQPGQTVPGGYKYGDLALQVEAVPNLRQQNMVMSPAGLGPENDCADEFHQKL